MRTKRTCVRRGASPRLGRSTRTRGRAMVRRQSARRGRRAMDRRQSARRRDRYGRRARTSQLSFGKSLRAGILAAAAALALAGYLVVHHGIRAAGDVGRGTDPVAAQFIYTAPTANDATITLPGAVQNELLQIGLAHRSIASPGSIPPGTYRRLTST
jgi:hypothetical protein